MKTSRIIGLALFAVLFCLSACSKGGDDPIEPTPKPEETKSEILIDSSIITNGLSFSTDKGEQSISFTTNENWTLSIASTTSGSSWCTASATSGIKGTTTVKFTVVENAEYDDRSVSVTIKAGAASKTFIVTQKGADALLVTANIYEVAKKGGKIEVEVKANIDYELFVSETAKDWITESKSESRALTTYKHTFEIAASEEAEKRIGEIMFQSGNKVEIVTVYQAGGAILLLSQNELSVGDTGEIISVEVKSNVEYGVQMPDVDWITDEASTRGMSSHTLKYVVSPNESYDNRSADIVFYDLNSDLKDTLKVVQAQKGAIVISQKIYEVKGEGEIIEVKLSSNVDFEVSTPDVDWIEQVESRALTEHTLYFNVEKNDGEEIRSAKILFTNKDSQLNDSIIISQQAKVSIAELNKAGTLRAVLGKNNYLNIKSLKIIGPINGDDIYYLRQMLGGNEFNESERGKLTVLDLTEANIVEGGSWYYTIENSYSRYYTSNDIIGPYMFSTCNNLERIFIKSWNIDEKAFYNSDALTSITIPRGEAYKIGDEAFADCDALTSVIFEGSSYRSKRIGRAAFNDCDALTSVTIPNFPSVEEVGRAAFLNCDALTSVAIRAKKIGYYAFDDCNALTSVAIEGCESIGFCAFRNCDALTSINIKNCNSIENQAFYDCDALTSITIPDNVTSIGKEAFYDCDALTSVSFGKGIASISEATFYDCDALTSITIPGNVTSIGKGAFEDCDALTSATIEKGTIGAWAFRNCRTLTSITLGEDVFKIDEKSFVNTSINTCYCYRKTPPSIGSYAFYNAVKDDAKLYVPARCVSIYKQFWGEYFKIIIEMD